MKLLDLLDKIDYVSYKNQNDIDFNRVTYDSRKVKKNGIFVAIKGKETDGHRFIESAIEKGAALIVHTEDIAYEENISYIKVKDSRFALGEISNLLTGFPSKNLRLIGVTGTNGKTTTATFIYRLFKKLDGSCTNIGTDGTFINDEKIDTPNTTPEISEINEILRRSLDQAIKNAVIEASSHGLYLHRLDGLDFDYGIFTNLSMEHMDFHKTMENYFKAKMLLLENSKKQVINIDDAYGKRAKEIYKAAITFSINEDSDFRAYDIKTIDKHLEFYVNRQKFILNRYAIFDIYNALAAIAVLFSEGYSLETIASCLKEIGDVKSRFEFIENKLGINIVIDFAHTPIAFEKTYQAVEKGKNIIAVYGMSGDRTSEIRRKVGEISAKNKVFSVLTLDDPKFDTYENIAADIASGIESFGGQYIMIKNRKDAIKYALTKAKKGDFVLLLGKGEENFLKLKGNEKIPYNEKETVKEILKDL
ncbi:MAG: UDP-N-acetylmuramoyl-L-alanyl-D-glutamate--2,6-diaminopimelate ligase [Peptoniphilaceae bacterium]|nr:UDP-N-acetylmuramoyl-L-alanyl-D-glutamate--2,6-diaminopimelate ligase [Peptoniphilaceae bacterium]MDY6019468.1 UDP-N-acetylmuramoyl-L-alanyl-D-glutamate--2,6-diaminopimelate ligase [Anaerococcus sp.]